MRPNQKRSRGRGFSPLVIRALGRSVGLHRRGRLTTTESNSYTSKRRPPVEDPTSRFLRSLAMSMMLVAGTALPLAPSPGLSPGSLSAQQLDFGHVAPSDAPDIFSHPACSDGLPEVLAPSRLTAGAEASSGCLAAVLKAVIAFGLCPECREAALNPSWTNALLCLECMRVSLQDDKDVAECWEDIKEWVKKKLGLDDEDEEEGSPEEMEDDAGKKH